MSRAGSPASETRWCGAQGDSAMRRSRRSDCASRSCKRRRRCSISIVGGCIKDAVERRDQALRQPLRQGLVEHVRRHQVDAAADRTDQQLARAAGKVKTFGEACAGIGLAIVESPDHAELAEVLRSEERRVGKECRGAWAEEQ